MIGYYYFFRTNLNVVATQELKLGCALTMHSTADFDTGALLHTGAA